MLSRKILRRLRGRFHYMTSIVNDFNQEANFARIQGGVYISPYPTPPDITVYENLESSLRLSSGGRFMSGFGIIGLQCTYYFYKIYSPFSYLYFGASMTLSTLLILTAMGASMHRLQNIAQMTLISPNRVKIIAGDGSKHELLISELKNTGYSDSRKLSMGHVISVKYGAKKGEVGINQSTTFSPQILWAILHPEVTHVMDQETARQFHQNLKQGIGKLQESDKK